ncbi:MAG: hypothetical protein CMI13_00140 [Oleibacter sp.]|nr:hypothetical protein [Thalassolituus sp.]
MESVLLGLIIFFVSEKRCVALRLADSPEQALYQLLFQCIFPVIKRTNLCRIPQYAADGVFFRPANAQ